mgnify:CR=1 FL=1
MQDDAEVIKRLITQWGSGVQEQVNVESDFLILGKEQGVEGMTAFLQKRSPAWQDA